MTDMVAAVLRATCHDFHGGSYTMNHVLDFVVPQDDQILFHLTSCMVLIHKLGFGSRGTQML